MLRKFSYLLALLFAASTGHHAMASVISGQVTDATTHTPLAGATVSIPELRLSVSTNQNGQFSFPSAPNRGQFMLEAKYIGYKTVTKVIDFSQTGQINFELKPSVIEVHEVVVTGTPASSANEKNSTVVTVITKEDLLTRPSTNIIDAISRIPGVSQITTGPAISKPIIRGLGYNRVITLANGIKQQGQQWGDEHGIEIDQYSADRVEVLMGAASLLYGSDALGGVINILEPTPPQPGTIKGEFLTNYATNNGLSGSSAMLQGNNNGFVWRTRGSYKNAYSYNTPEGRIPNTGFNETTLSAMLGLNRSWGYAHLDLSSFSTKLGIPEFEKQEDGTYVNEEGQLISTGRSRHLLLPFQDISHYKAALNSYVLLGEGKLKSTLGFQNNRRKELEESTTDPSLYFDLNTYSYDFKYYLPQIGDWEPVIGASGEFQHSVNKAPERLIPDYNSQQYGAFAYLKRTWERSSVNAGIRYDYRNIDGKLTYEVEEAKFPAFTNNFSNISGAIGFTHEFNDQLNFKANAGSAFRAPNIAELSSSGVHEGTSRYEIGDINLKPERSIYADAALEYHTDKADVHFNVYNNYITNYIYLRQLTQEQTDGHDTFNYVQDNSNLYGMEAGLTLHPVSLVHFENTFSITRGRNRATKEDLPFIPAPVLRNELRFEPRFASSSLKKSWISVGLDNYFKQDRVDPIFETPTGAYTLLNASLGTNLQIGKQSVKVTISGNNLLDKAYIDHLSRYKIAGFLNPGRNISFGLYIPLTLASK